MVKKSLLLLSLMCFLPVCAGELEDAMAAREKVFLYLYTKDCGYCNKFNPIYNKISSAHAKEYAFVKVNAATPYGMGLMRQFRAGFVPYVLVINKNKQAKWVYPDCLLDVACVEKEIKNF